MGNSRTVVLNEFIKTFEDILGKKAKMECLLDQPDDVKTTFTDIGKAKRMLKYKSSVSLREGLTEITEWHYAQASFLESRTGA